MKAQVAPQDDHALWRESHTGLRHTGWIDMSHTFQPTDRENGDSSALLTEYPLFAKTGQRPGDAFVAGSQLVGQLGLGTGKL